MREVIIIGSGPAGWTAAIYTARAGLKPLLIASSVEAGGELMKTTEVENYPGFPEGLMGPDLMANFQAQAERFGTETLLDDVVEVDLRGDVKNRFDPRAGRFHTRLGGRFMGRQAADLDDFGERFTGRLGSFERT